MAKLSKSNDLEKVVSQIEDENVAELNGTLVAEDGYIHDEPLLAGYVDEQGVRHSTFTYREMNGKDEEAINKSEVSSNGGKLVNVLVTRCVTEIGTLTKKELGTSKWEDLVKKLLGGDLDYMAFKIRELSKGKEVEYTHICPECKAKLVTVVQTDEFNIIDFKGMITIPFTLPRGYRDKLGVVHKEGVMRLANGLDREIVIPLFKKNKATATTMLLTRTMIFDDGAVVTNDLVGNMFVRDREYLEKIIRDNTFGIDTSSLEITCTSCGADLSNVEGQSNFL